MLDYVTIYKISGGTSGFPFALVGLVPLAVGLILTFGKSRLNWRLRWPFICFWYGFAIMWVFLAGGPVLTNGMNAFTAFQSGRYSVVEGTVENFHPMPYQGHDEECFSVASQRFCYSDYEVTSGFHNTASHGGPIRSGIHVRISYLGGTILKLEIARSDLLRPAAKG